MLYAIVDRLSKEKDLNPKFVAGKINGTPEQIRKAGLYQIPNTQRFKIKLQNLYTQPQLDKLGLVKRKNINVLLDAGGFQFGDQWTDLYTQHNNKQLLEYYREYKSNGCKIIFLPQAFGPFGKSLLKERMKGVFEIADLIYARDRTSYNYLIQFLGIHQKIKIAPDFTGSVSPKISLKNYHLAQGGICLIPNSKMITHSEPKISAAYKDFLKSLGKYFIDNGEKIILLNHEGLNDYHIIEDLKKEFNNSITFNGLDAYEIKGIIGCQKLAISSRFHGVVNGLMQNVPTFCTSWSHKYNELMEDFNIPYLQLDPCKIDYSISQIQKASTSLDKIRKTIRSQSISVLNTSETMWREILDLIMI